VIGSRLARTRGTALLRDRQYQLILVIVAFGALLRITMGVLFPRDVHTMGNDAIWYWQVARNWADFGFYSRDGISFTALRPPGFAAFLAGVFATGLQRPAAALVAISVTSATGSWTVAHIARRVFPSYPVLPVVAALVYAIDPVQTWAPRTYMSEGVVVPLTLAFVLATIDTIGRPTWSRFVCVGVLGALITHMRFDLAALALAAPILGIGYHGAQRRLTRHMIKGWLAAGAIAITLCVPWSVYATSQAGYPVMMSRVPPVEGFRFWLGTTSLPSRLWAQIRRGYWRQAPQEELLPADVFYSDEEAHEVREMLREIRRLGRTPNAMDTRFRELARQRITAHPFFYYVTLPLTRSVRMWSHIEQAGTPVRGLFLDARPSSIVFSLWSAPYVLLAFAGFLLAWTQFWKLSNPASWLSNFILMRTYTILGAGTLIGAPMFEPRYLAQVEPLAIMLTLAALGAVGRRYHEHPTEHRRSSVSSENRGAAHPAEPSRE